MVRQLIFLLMASFIVTPSFAKKNFNGDVWDYSKKEPELKEKVFLLKRGMNEEELLFTVGKEYMERTTYRNPWRISFEGKEYLVERVYSYIWVKIENENIIGPDGTVIGIRSLVKERLYVSIYLWEGKVLFWSVDHHYYNQGPGRRGETKGELYDRHGFKKSDLYYPGCGPVDYFKDYDKGTWAGGCKTNCQQRTNEGLDPCELETVRYYWETIEMGKLPEEYKKDIPKR